MAMFSPGDDDALDRVKEMFGPAQIDQQIRQAIQFCWMGLPKERRTVEEVDAQIRRLVDRALKDPHEDAQAFDLPGLG